MRSIVGRTTGPDPGAFFFHFSSFFSFNLCCIVVVCGFTDNSSAFRPVRPPVATAHWKLSARLLFISGFHFHFHFELQLRRKLHNLWAHPARWLLGQGCRQAAASSLRFLHCCACNSQSVCPSVSSSASQSASQWGEQPVHSLLIHTASQSVSQSFIRSSIELDRPAISGSILLRCLPASDPCPNMLPSLCGRVPHATATNRNHIKSNINKKSQRNTAKYVCSLSLS